MESIQNSNSSTRSMNTSTVTTNDFIYNKKIAYIYNNIPYDEFKHPVLDKKTRQQQAAIQGFKVVQDFINKGIAHSEFFFKKIHHLSDKIQSIHCKEILQFV